MSRVETPDTTSRGDGRAPFRLTLQRRPLTPAALAVLEFLAAFAIAGIAALAIWTQLPRQLDVRTEIVGYPIHSNFNSYLYLWRYWLLAGFLPLLTLALFVLLSRLIPGGDTWRGPRARQPAPEPPAPAASRRSLVATALGRTLFLGAVLGLELATIAFQEKSWIVKVGVPVTLGYAVLASLTALAAGRIGRAPEDFWARLALVNVFAVALCFAGLYGVARSTRLTIASTGEVHTYTWLPWWLAAPATALLLASGIFVAARARDSALVHAYERRLVLLVVGPVALLIFLAGLPGALAPMDMFHEGEPLAGAHLTAEGAFPWRDLIFIHGFLRDVLIPQFGFALIEDSRWGFFAGTVLVVGPLYWTSLYFLCAYLFHRNWLFLVGTQVAVVLGVIFEVSFRFMLLPAALLLLAALFSRPTALRAAAFTAVLLVQAVVTPEAGILVVALVPAVVLFELCYYRRGRRLAENFRRTALCAASGAVLTILWLGFLAVFGAADDFIFAYRTFASGHELTGALPVVWLSDRFTFDVIAPVVIVVLAIWYFGIQFLRGRGLTVADWTMGGLALFVGLYYYKFLARSDPPHLYESFAPAVPLVCYVLYRAIAALGNGVERFRPALAGPARLAATAVALTIVVAEAPQSLDNVVPNAPTRLDVTLPAPPKVPAAGFILWEQNYVDITRGLDTIIDTYVGPKDAVFDFTNNPGLFYYLLDRPSPTRYYHVSMAIRSGTQDDLVEELERARPKLVIYSGNLTGFQFWDGISNQVRHYRVSRYLLAHYRPLVKWKGYVFMGLNGVRYPPASSIAAKVNGGVTRRGLYSKTQPCDWGYAPNFFAEQPSAASQMNPLPLRATRLGAMRGWAIDPKARRPAAAVLVAIGNKVVARFEPMFRRPDIVAHFRSRRYLRSGFDVGHIQRPLRSGESLWRTRLYGLSHAGQAGELSYGPDAPPSLRPGSGPRSLVLGGRRIPVVGGAALGYLDSATFPDHLLQIDVPRGTDLTRYHWLEIQTASPLHENSFVFTDLTSNIDHGVQFKTLGRGATTVRVNVGACSQWYGYRTRRLYMYSSAGETVQAVRLYR
jgi:hypothetical protein